VPCLWKFKISLQIGLASHFVVPYLSKVSSKIHAFGFALTSGVFILVIVKMHAFGFALTSRMSHLSCGNPCMVPCHHE